MAKYVLYLGCSGADFIVDYTQVQQVNTDTFNVVLVRNPYATIYAGDFVAVSTALASHLISAGGRTFCHQKMRVSASRHLLHGRREVLMQETHTHCDLAQTGSVRSPVLSRPLQTCLW